MNTFLKYFFVVINLVLVAVGVFCIGFVLWVDGAPIVNEILTAIKIDTALFYCGVLLGAILMFVGVCGALGSFYEKKWILTLYMVIMFLFVVWEFVIIIYAAVEGSGEFVEELEKVWVSLHNDTKFIVQDVFNCCGYLNASEWKGNYHVSCLNLTVLNVTVPWAEPCSENVLYWFRDNMLAVAGGMITTILFQIFQAITTGLLIRSIVSSKQDDNASDSKLGVVKHGATQLPHVINRSYRNEAFVDETVNEDSGPASS